MKGLKQLAAVAALAFAQPLVAQDEPYGAPVRVLTASDLRAAGVFRISDALTLVDDWDVSTIDGFTWDAAPRGLGPFARQSWAVFVDGVEVGLSVFGRMSLERLPITFSQIDSIAVVSAPAFYAGRFVSGGALHFYTSGVQPGLSARARVMVGNESGDPGPFSSTPLNTPNIDRIGEDFSGGLSYGAPWGFVEFDALQRPHYVTDEALVPRLTAVAVSNMAEAVRARVGAVVGDSRHTLTLEQSDYDDTHYLPAFGREIRAGSVLHRGALAGSFGALARPAVRYSVSHERNEFEPEPNRLDRGFDLRLQRTEFNVELDGAAPAPLRRLGLTARRVVAAAGSPLDDDDYVHARLYAGVASDQAARTQWSIDLGVAAAEGGVGFEAAWSMHSQLTLRHAVGATVTYAHRLPEDDKRIWFWVERGYDLLNRLAVAVPPLNQLDVGNQLTIDVRWQAEVATAVEATVSAFVRRITGMLLLDQAFTFQPVDEFFSSPLVLRFDQRATVFGADLRTQWEPTPLLELSSYYRFMQVDGNDAIGEQWASVPRHKLSQRLLFRPVPSLSLWGSLSHQSATTWPAYEGAERQTGRRYSSRIEDMTLLHVAVEKWVASKRARGSIGLRNLLNDTMRYHPIGASFATTMYVQVELLLDSLL